MSGREAEAREVIHSVMCDYNTTRDPLLADIALSLAIIADALRFQAEQRFREVRGL